MIATFPLARIVLPATVAALWAPTALGQWTAPSPEETDVKMVSPSLALSESALFWADWSGDGLPDVWAVQPDGSGSLLENLGDGTFANRTPDSGLADVSGVHHVSFGDVDGDGVLDVYLASTSLPSLLFLQTEQGNFIDVTPTSGLTESLAPMSSRWIDFDADGVLDLHLITTTGDVVYRGLGRAQFEEVDLGLMLAPPTVTGGLPPSETGTDGTSAATGGVTSSIATSQPPAANAGNSGICAATIEDASTGACIGASSSPQQGMLYPLSQDLYVSDTTGFVGIGTTTPGDRLSVNGIVRALRLRSDAPNGVNPIILSSSTLVNNLNAELLGGFFASDFRRVANSIQSSDIPDATITDLDVSTSAAIQGSKINPAFGTQTVSGLSGANFAHPNQPGGFALKAEMSNLSAYGFIGVNGTADFDGIASLDVPGLDIGVIGASIGGSSVDNIGVLGHSNTVGVRGEHSVASHLNYGELGREGIGVFGRGETAAGRFQGRVEIDSPSLSGLIATGGHMTAPTARFTNPNGGGAMELVSSTASGSEITTVFSVTSQNSGRTATITSTHPSASRETLRVESQTDAATHDLSYFRRTGAGTGSAIRVDVTDPAGAADGARVVVGGSGIGTYVESRSGTTLHLNKATNSADILVAANGADVEFRVDSTGGVFCDGVFTGGGADYAEWLPRLRSGDRFAKGDVVGVHGGRISHNTDGADTILVISTNPVLVGNHLDAAASSREGHEIVGFLGQVPIRVRGTVRSGDFLVASDQQDGTAVAVSAADLDASMMGDVVGQAWESSAAAPEGATRTVNAAIGLERDRIAALVIQAMRSELDQVQGMMEALAERLVALESQR